VCVCVRAFVFVFACSLTCVCVVRTSGEYATAAGVCQGIVEEEEARFPFNSNLAQSSCKKKHLSFILLLDLEAIIGRTIKPRRKHCLLRTLLVGEAPRPHTQTGPPVSATRPSLVLFSRALCARMCAIAIALACLHPPRTHAPRPHTQTGPPVV